MPANRNEINQPRLDLIGVLKLRSILRLREEDGYTSLGFSLVRALLFCLNGAETSPGFPAIRRSKYGSNPWRCAAPVMVLSLAK
jgi:hypothetical protein